MFMDKEGMTLATEIFQELKASARRWFIAFIAMCCLEVGTISGFVWYISLPVDTEQVTVDNEDGNANYIGDDLNGDLNNGESNSEANTESSKK